MQTRGPTPINLRNEIPSLLCCPPSCNPSSLVRFERRERREDANRRYIYKIWKISSLLLIKFKLMLPFRVDRNIVRFIFHFYFLFLLKYMYICICIKQNIFYSKSEMKYYEQCEIVQWSWWKERSPVTSLAIKEMTHLVASLFLTRCYITIIDQTDISRTTLVQMLESVQSSASFIFIFRFKFVVRTQRNWIFLFFSWNNRVHILSCQIKERGRERMDVDRNTFSEEIYTAHFSPIQCNALFSIRRRKWL